MRRRQRRQSRTTRALGLAGWEFRLQIRAYSSFLEPARLAYDVTVDTKLRGLLTVLGLALAISAWPSLATAASAPASYVLHPGDQLAITVYGEPTLSQTTQLLTDGSITYPLVGRLNLGGKTIGAATQMFTHALQRYVRDPLVTISVAQQGAYEVLVLGDVKTPGKYSLPSTARVADAIAAAGGLGEINGDYPDARVSIGNAEPITVSLQKLLREGDVASNPPLGSQSVVYVPGPTPMQVQVIGNVDKPGYAQVHTGDRLSMAIAVAGTTANSLADLAHIRLTRTQPNGATVTTQYNLYNALKGGDIASDPLLQKNDIVYVPQAHQGDKLSVFAQGIIAILSRLIVPF